MIRVGKTKCDTESINEAIELARHNNDREIFITNGIYKEKILLDISNITITGEDREKTIITYGDYAKKKDCDGIEYGTFRTATFRIDADNVTLNNLTIKNSAGNGRDYGQAIALYSEGDEIRVNSCKLIGCQDTLFAAPLPPKKPGIGKNGKGPKADCERKNGNQYYIDCYIEGDIDFIFGGARAYFKNCNIFSRKNITEEDGRNGDNIIKGFVAAPCTPQSEKIGFVFNNCIFESDNDPETVYLGRPWREYAKVAIINSKIGNHIKSCGWHDWNKPEAHTTMVFAEYNNTNNEKPVDMSLRENYVHNLSESEAQDYIDYFER